MSTAFSMHAFTPFLMCDATCEEFLCHGNGSPDKILSIFFWHRRIGKCISKLILASYVRTRCQVVFNNEHSLHLWKRHPCTSTIERQLTDWSEQVTTWRDLRALLYSHSDIVCLLIQTNCIELQPSINILIWVTWFFDHPVLISHRNLKWKAQNLSVN
jgi:hypothetical protein